MNESTARKIFEEPAQEPPSLRDLGLPKWMRLVAASGYGDRLAEAEQLFDLLTQGWSDLPAKANPQWSTDITDDGTPFEFSLAVEGDHFQPRLLVEPFARGRSPGHDSSGLEAKNEDSQWVGGLDLNQGLSEKYDAELDRFELLSPLFTPVGRPLGLFRMWHAAALERDGGVSSKIYLNPRSEGDPSGRFTVLEALRQLQLSDAADFLEKILSPQAFIPYFSLDLARGATARTKVYVAEPDLSGRELDELLGPHGVVAPGEVTRWTETLTGGCRSLGSRPFLASYAFTSATSLPSLTLHVPIREYVEHDEQALARAVSLLAPRLGGELRDKVTAFADRPLDMGRGLISYVSLRQAAGKTRITLYLSPELFGIAAPRTQSSLPVPRESMVRELSPRLADSWLPPAASLLPPKQAKPLKTFGDVRDLIEERRQTFIHHPLLRRLGAPMPLDMARVVASGVAFFVMTFQDVLRLVAERIVDPELGKLAKIIESGDRNHDQWYLNDVQRLGFKLDAAWLFGSEHNATRDAGYTILAQALTNEHDISLMALVVSLEAAGQDFFPQMAQMLAAFAEDQPFEYFGMRHIEAEAAHDPFHEDSPVLPADLLVSPLAEPEIRRTVENTFAATESMADAIWREIETTTARVV